MEKCGSRWFSAARAAAQRGRRWLRTPEVRTALAVHHAQHPVRHVGRPRHEQVVPPRRREAVRRRGRRARKAAGALRLPARGSGTTGGGSLAGARQRGRVRRHRQPPRLDSRSAGAALRAKDGARVSEGEAPSGAAVVPRQRAHARRRGAAQQRTRHAAEWVRHGGRARAPLRRRRPRAHASSSLQPRARASGAGGTRGDGRRRREWRRCRTTSYNCVYDSATTGAARREALPASVPRGP